jgi:hypothetical protein
MLLPKCAESIYKRYEDTGCLLGNSFYLYALVFLPLKKLSLCTVGSAQLVLHSW